jgi:hypothetical protein
MGHGVVGAEKTDRQTALQGRSTNRKKTGSASAQWWATVRGPPADLPPVHPPHLPSASLCPCVLRRSLACCCSLLLLPTVPSAHLAGDSRGWGCAGAAQRNTIATQTHTASYGAAEQAGLSGVTCHCHPGPLCTRAPLVCNADAAASVFGVCQPAAACRHHRRVQYACT